MTEKELILARLDNLSQRIHRSETEDELHRLLRYSWISDHVLGNEIEHYLRRIDYNLHRLATRPVPTCRMATVEGEALVELMIGRDSGERARGEKYLSNWLDNANTLTITDPYLMKTSGQLSESDYTSALASLLPQTLTKLELFTGLRNKQYQKPTIAAWFNTHCQSQHIALTVYHQEEVHDRVWIKHGTTALVVGTSFNGLGNKCAFLLHLDSTDTGTFIGELARIRATYRSQTSV